MSSHSADSPSPRVPPKAAARAIIRAIREADVDLRSRHWWLARRYQNRVALAWYAFAMVCIVGTAAAWWFADLPAVLAVVGIALALSVLHELEHDLIHDLYYVDRPAVQNLMFAGIWIAKMSLNPWARRRIHRYHHQVSGQPEDIEERLIGLGLPWGLQRLALSVLPAGSVTLARTIDRDVRNAVREGAPAPDLNHARGFVLLRGVDTAFFLAPLVVVPLAYTGLDWAVSLLVLWVLPNTIRHFSIVVVSSNSHYTHIPRSELWFQNQVLDHWLTWPLQLFCFHFGATHILHHYVVKQPFWLRQLVAPRVRPVLRANGVQFNDLGTFARANRHPDASAVQAH